MSQQLVKPSREETKTLAHIIEQVNNTANIGPLKQEINEIVSEMSAYLEGKPSSSFNPESSVGNLRGIANYLNKHTDAHNLAGVLSNQADSFEKNLPQENEGQPINNQGFAAGLKSRMGGFARSIKG